MLDTLIRHALVVDGSGAAGRKADVGIRDGRIAWIREESEPGSTAEEAGEVIDAQGLVLCPGFIDPHTHYDAQLFWDPHATPSTLHGVTTVIGGNCGFSLAPLVPEDADYLRRMMAKVEGMPLAALESGLSWDWRGFGEYLGRFDAGLGLNAGFLVGHCAIRRTVMGERAVGEEATSSEIDAMVQLLHESIEAGGLGFSTSLSFTHSDGDGKPVPSRWASHDEVLALCRALRDHEGTSLEFILDGCLQGFEDDEIELMTRMSLEAERPANWNVLSVDARNADRAWHQLRASEKAAERGARIVALTMPILSGVCVNFATHSAIHLIPGWGEVMGLPIPERAEKLRDPEVRRELDAHARSKKAGVFRGMSRWAGYEIATAYSEENRPLVGRKIRDVAAERGVDAFDALVDVALADDLRTIFWPPAGADDPESWQLRAEIWNHPYALLGGSDAGAHLDRMCGSPYPTIFLADVLRGRQLVPLERAVELMTRVPAELFGLRERGEIREGFHADLVLFDPESIDSEPVREQQDLPGESARLTAGSKGVSRVLVNGETTIVDGQPAGAKAGRILRSGADTRTPPLSP